MLNTINHQGNIKQNHNEKFLCMMKAHCKATGGSSVEELKISCIADGNVKWFHCFGKNLVVSYQEKHLLSICCNSSTQEE